jgi:NAD(P)-dependent dehydrogenase (short-subunit alcohol dehydrogenase family)
VWCCGRCERHNSEIDGQIDDFEDRVNQTTRTSPVAIITGASSGIGRALALRLGAAGTRVGLIARRRDLIDEAVREIIAAGGSAHAAQGDVSDRDGLFAAVAEIEAQLGPTDVMVANAGFGAPTHLDPLNTADVEQTFRVNLMGVVYSIESVLPGMLARNRGQLVAISSLAAFKGLPGESAYCASKAAVNAYTEGLRIALCDKGIVVTTVCPGFVRTDMTPMDSPTPFEMSADATAQRIARVIASRRSGVVRFPWPMALLTSLIAHLPDRIVARIVAVPAPKGPSEPHR